MSLLSRCRHHEGQHGQHSLALAQRTSMSLLLRATGQVGESTSRGEQRVVFQTDSVLLLAEVPEASRGLRRGADGCSATQ